MNKGLIAVFSRMRGNKILERLTVQDSNTPHSCDYRYNTLNSSRLGHTPLIGIPLINSLSRVILPNFNKSLNQ
jgi:hypothetical protein